MQNPFPVHRSPYVCNKKWNIRDLCYFHMQLTWLDWSRSRSRSFWSRSHNRFLVSVSVSISVSHSLVSVLALVSLCSGLINKPGMLRMYFTPTVAAINSLTRSIHKWHDFIFSHGSRQHCTTELTLSKYLQVKLVFIRHSADSMWAHVRFSWTYFGITNIHQGKHYCTCRLTICRVATHLENLEKSGNSKVVGEKSAKHLLPWTLNELKSKLQLLAACGPGLWICSSLTLL